MPLATPVPGTPAPAHRPVAPTHAVVWLDRHQALVATAAALGEATVEDVLLDETLPEEPATLAAVAHRVRDVSHVLILGPDEMRTALEREVVAIAHRPERIREERTHESPARDLLLERLATFMT